MGDTAPLRVVVIDDSHFQCELLRGLLEHRYGDDVTVEIYRDPESGVEALSPEVDLLLLDWQMPGMDGTEVIEAAAERGLPRKRIIISSAHPADTLHEIFDARGCLAVIEKGEKEQQAAFLMILDGVMRRHRRALAKAGGSS